MQLSKLDEVLLDLLRLNKKIVIYGKGRSGKAIHKYLKLYDINSFLVDDADGSSEIGLSNIQLLMCDRLAE